MMKNDVITEAMIRAAFAVLEKRIEAPPPPEEKRYSRREAFQKLRSKAREAMAAGHSLETVLDDLKGVGLGMTISTARQYLKPGKKSNRARISVERVPARTQSPKRATTTLAPTEGDKKGTFNVIEDDKEI